MIKIYKLRSGSLFYHSGCLYVKFITEDKKNTFLVNLDSGLSEIIEGETVVELVL